MNIIGELVNQLKQAEEIRNQDEKDTRNTLAEISEAYDHELKKIPRNEEEITQLKKEYKKAKENNAISIMFLDYIKSRIAFLMRLIAKDKKAKEKGRKAADDYDEQDEY